MTSLSLNQLLVIYAWFPLAMLLLFALLIARLYEKFSKKQTYSRFFLFPLILFAVSAVRYASLDSAVGDPLGDILIGIGGFVLAILSFRLYWLMMNGRKEE
ncbi:MAG TPA: hypothetical protein PLZ51_21175 [Aggregatilineales bacterium]|nr:hypothetical protein [Aggregatilineales bacterium]